MLFQRSSKILQHNQIVEHSQESEKGKGEMGTSSARKIPLLGNEGVLDGMKANDILKIVETIVTVRCMRKVSE